MFDADRPITKSDQDRLGRMVFAKYLARCIFDHKDHESLVIGLYGGWGSGKTSLINLTLEELRFAASNMFDDERPIILNFSPWSYSGQGQLIYSFFRRLSSELRNSPYLENSDKIINLLELYVSFFTHQPIPHSLQLKHKFIEKVTKRRMIKDEALGWESGRDLTLVKAELNELLKKSKHKIIIFIDNISRIEDSEIKQIFQIVKSMGDYANTVYVLAMDKEHVIQSMDHVYGKGGEEYLEKIVQLPFEIPDISCQDLEPLLLERLKRIISGLPEGTWDNNYWADLYYSTLKYFFKNCRDITHYINTLSFSFERVKDVVNPVDFFAITALEVFTPEIFFGIRDNKDLFTDLVENVYQFDAEKLAEDKLRCDEILNRSSHVSREQLQQLLIRLFPRLRNMYEASIPFYHSEAIARKNLRICSPDVFDIYFRLSIPQHDISEPEMKAILSISHDEEGFALALLRLNQDDRITRFLDLLDGTIVHKVKKAYFPKVINALMDSADLFPEGENNSVSFNTPMRIHRLFNQMLYQFDSKERFTIFNSAIRKANKSLYIIVHELIEQHKEHSETEDTFIPLEFRSFSPDQLKQLQMSAVEKIKYWAQIGRLAEHPRLMPILYAWESWSDPAECKEYVAQLVRDDKSLVAFLCAALKEPIDQAMTKLEKNASWAEYLRDIEDFISPYILEPHVRMLFEEVAFEQWREREQLAILIFLDLIKADTVKVIPKTTV